MLELDIWIPSLNKAIEFNGVYWHDNNYKDNIKIKKCKEQGIELLVITDIEWITKNEIYKKIIIDFIGR